MDSGQWKSKAECLNLLQNIGSDMPNEFPSFLHDLLEILQVIFDMLSLKRMIRLRNYMAGNSSLKAQLWDCSFRNPWISASGKDNRVLKRKRKSIFQWRVEYVMDSLFDRKLGCNLSSYDCSYAFANKKNLVIFREVRIGEHFFGLSQCEPIAFLHFAAIASDFLWKP